jgi:prepilin-type N-terminal cleavage/methylation domain-containing protein
MTTQRGFTLIEMAIVLVIITILIGGLAVPLSAQIQARRIAETRADMNAIRDALIGYAMSHTTECTCNYDAGSLTTTNPSTGCEQICPLTSASSSQLRFTRHYLPCPDYESPATGVEPTRDASGQCPKTRGTLPWRTLGVKGQDVWGNRYTYAVTREYANNQNGFVSTPSPSTPGDLNVYPDANCNVASVAENVPVVVVSHGPNGRGAQNMSGGTPLAAAAMPADGHERQNLIAPSAVSPCSNTTSFVSRAPSDTFDDLVVWLSANELFNRVCLAGGCL